MVTNNSTMKMHFFLRWLSGVCAERSTCASRTIIPTGREPDSPFEAEVIRALRHHGWIVHPQVGCSGYRLDIGAVHPDYPGTFLLGVECDGASYHSLPTARDRDRLRQLVLEGLGWTLNRIWSTDWWTDTESEISKLEKLLNKKLSEFSGFIPVTVNAIPSLDSEP